MKNISWPWFDTSRIIQLKRDFAGELKSGGSPALSIELTRKRTGAQADWSATVPVALFDSGCALIASRLERNRPGCSFRFALARSCPTGAQPSRLLSSVRAARSLERNRPGCSLPFAPARSCLTGAQPSRLLSSIRAVRLLQADWSATVPVALFDSRCALIASETLALQSACAPVRLRSSPLAL